MIILQYFDVGLHKVIIIIAIFCSIKKSREFEAASVQKPKYNIPMAFGISMKVIKVIINI